MPNLNLSDEEIKDTELSIDEVNSLNNIVGEKQEKLVPKELDALLNCQRRHSKGQGTVCIHKRPKNFNKDLKNFNVLFKKHDLRLSCVYNKNGGVYIFKLNGLIIYRHAYGTDWNIVHEKLPKIIASFLEI